MKRAIEFMRLNWLTRWLTAVALPQVEVQHTAKEFNQLGTMHCPYCHREYGTLPSFPNLVQDFSLVRCPCGKLHIGYKPFNGFC